MSSRCIACGHENVDFASVCSGCGVALRGNASNITPLAALMPEAEPPLPTAHEALRTRQDPTPGRIPLEPRRDPTPGRDTTKPARRDPTPARVPLERKDPTPARVHAEIAAPSTVDASGPLEDPSAWFDDNTPESARRLTPSAPDPSTPTDPREPNAVPLGEASLVSSSAFWRRALMLAALCLVVGALVGWVLSR